MEEAPSISQRRKKRETIKQQPCESKRKRASDALKQESSAPQKKAKSVKKKTTSKGTDDTDPVPVPLDFPLSQSNKYIPCFGRKKKKAVTATQSVPPAQCPTRGDEVGTCGEKPLQSNTSVLQKDESLPLATENETQNSAKAQDEMHKSSSNDTSLEHDVDKKDLLQHSVKPKVAPLKIGGSHDSNAHIPASIDVTLRNKSELDLSKCKPACTASSDNVEKPIPVANEICSIGAEIKQGISFKTTEESNCDKQNFTECVGEKRNKDGSNKDITELEKADSPTKNNKSKLAKKPTQPDDDISYSPQVSPGFKNTYNEDEDVQKANVVSSAKTDEENYESHPGPCKKAKNTENRNPSALESNLQLPNKNDTTGPVSLREMDEHGMEETPSKQVMESVSSSAADKQVDADTTVANSEATSTHNNTASTTEAMEQVPQQDEIQNTKEIAIVSHQESNGKSNPEDMATLEANANKILDSNATENVPGSSGPTKLGNKKDDCQDKEPNQDCGEFFMELTDSQLCSFDDELVMDQPLPVANVSLIVKKPVHKPWKPEPRMQAQQSHQPSMKLVPDPTATRNIKALIEELAALSEMMKCAKQELQMPCPAMPPYQQADFSGYQQ